VEGWKLADRQYDQVRKKTHADTPLDHQQRIAREWLVKHVIPAVDEYWRRPAFQSQATSTIRAFEQEDSPEQTFVNSLEAALQTFAAALINLADRRMVSTHLTAIYPLKLVAVESAVSIGHPPAETIDTPKVSLAVPDLDIEWNQVRLMANEPIPLVNVNDYFEPVQEYAKVNGKPVQRGGLIVSLNQALMPVGDFIVWALIERVERRVRILESFRTKLIRAMSKTTHPYTKLQANLVASHENLKLQMNQLRPAFQLGNENRLRNGCAVLAQVYAAFRPEADCAWLGLNEDRISDGRIVVRHRFEAYRSLESFDLVARSLPELQHLYEDGPDTSELDEAISQGGLVIALESKNSGSVWWEGTEIRSRFPKFGFQTLLLLARKARRRQPVAEVDIYDDDDGSKGRFPMMVNRLKKCLPQSLNALIEPGKVPHTYLLKLDRSQVYIASNVS